MNVHAEVVRPNSRFRFGPRQFLLFSAAISAAVALAILVPNWPKRKQNDQTIFFQNFDHLRLLASTFADLGVEERDRSPQEAQGSHRGSSNRFSATYPNFTAEPDELIKQVGTRLRAQIDQSGAAVTSLSFHADPDSKELKSVSIGYQEGGIHGVVQIAASKSGPEALKVWGFVHDCADGRPRIQVEE